MFWPHSLLTCYATTVTAIFSDTATANAPATASDNDTATITDTIQLVFEFISQPHSPLLFQSIFSWLTPTR